MDQSIYVERLYAKLHRVLCTEADLDYVGSLTVDQDWIDAAEMHEGQKVAVLNMNNGSRIETYLFNGERGSGVVKANGAAAHVISKGDTLLVLSYAMMELEKSKRFQPKVLLFDDVKEDSYFVQGKSLCYKENRTPTYEILDEQQRVLQYSFS